MLVEIEMVSDGGSFANTKRGREASFPSLVPSPVLLRKTRKADHKEIEREGPFPSFIPSFLLRRKTRKTDNQITQEGTI